MAKTKFEEYLKESIKNEPELEVKLRKAEIALDIAYQIYDLRQKKGLTQTELAKLIGVNQSNIARLENAEYSGYSLRTLQKIAKALGSNLNIILATPEQTSLVLSSLYNSYPTATQIKSAGNDISVIYWGSMSYSASELVSTNSQFEPTDFNLSIKSEDSNNGFKYLTL